MAGAPAWAELIRRGRQPETVEAILQAAIRLCTSGQLADGRVALEEVLRRDSRHIRALRELEWLLLRTPQRQQAEDVARRRLAAEADELFILALRRLRRGDRDTGRDYTAQLAAHASGHAGLPYLLALLGNAVPPPALPPEITALIYDGLAGRYDWHSRSEWRRRGPARVFAAVSAAQSELAGCLIADIGCGTGLAGEAFAAASGRLEGIELSVNMAERARRRRLENQSDRPVYDLVETGDFQPWLLVKPARYDIILAVDALEHTGVLKPAFAAVAAALKPDGIFAFSHLRAEAASFEIDSRGNYAHNPFHVRQALTTAGLSLESSDHAVLQDAGIVQVKGDVLIARRRSG